MPFTKLTPWMTSIARQAIAQQSAERGEVSEAAQLAPVFLGTLTQFEHHVQHSVAAEASLCALGPMADRGEGTLDWV